MWRSLILSVFTSTFTFLSSINLYGQTAINKSDLWTYGVLYQIQHSFDKTISYSSDVLKMTHQSFAICATHHKNTFYYGLSYYTLNDYDNSVWMFDNNTSGFGFNYGFIHTFLPLENRLNISLQANAYFYSITFSHNRPTKYYYALSRKSLMKKNFERSLV